MYFEEYEVGMVFKDIEPISFTEEELISYGQKFDPRDIHTDKIEASKSPFGQIISPGSFSNMAFWGQWVKTGRDKEGMIAGFGINYARWLRPVLPNTLYRIEVEIVDKKVYKEGVNGLVSFMMRAYDPEGNLVSEYNPEGLVSFRTNK